MYFGTGCCLLDFPFLFFIFVLSFGFWGSSNFWHESKDIFHFYHEANIHRLENLTPHLVVLLILSLSLRICISLYLSLSISCAFPWAIPFCSLITFSPLFAFVFFHSLLRFFLLQICHPLQGKLSFALHPIINTFQVGSLIYVYVVNFITSLFIFLAGGILASAFRFGHCDFSVFPEKKNYNLKPYYVVLGTHSSPLF